MDRVDCAQKVIDDRLTWEDLRELFQQPWYSTAICIRIPFQQLGDALDLLDQYNLVWSMTKCKPSNIPLKIRDVYQYCESIGKEPCLIIRCAGILQWSPKEVVTGLDYIVFDDAIERLMPLYETPVLLPEEFLAGLMA